jgi:hypothetical protein
MATSAVVLAVTAPALLRHLGHESAPARLLDPSGSVSARGADTERSAFLLRGWHEFLDHPVLGSGFGGPYTFYYHNGVLEVAVATGVLGAAAYLLIAGSLCRVLLLGRTWRRLGYAALAYFAAAMFVPTVWDRFAWAPLSLVLVAHTLDAAERRSVSASDLTEERTGP